MPKKPSTKPSGKDAAVKELRATVAALESRLAKAQDKTDAWKGRAKAAQADAGAVRAKVAKLEKKLEKALAKSAPSAGVGAPLTKVPTKKAAATKAPAKKTAAKSAEKAPAVEAAPPATPAEPSTTPDLSWTLVRLRQEARRRGVVYTGKSKAQLISALS